MKINSLEHQSAVYWSLCRQYRCNRWNELATKAMTALLQSTYDHMRTRACDLWYRVSQ